MSESFGGLWSKDDASPLEWEAMLYSYKLRKERVYTCPKCQGKSLSCECYQEVERLTKYVRSRVGEDARNLKLHPKVPDKVFNWIKLWHPGKNLILFGNVGLADLTIKKLTIDFLDKYSNSENAIYFRFIELLDFMAKSWNHEILKDDLSNKFEKFSLIAISGISSTIPFDNRYSNLLTYLDKRYSKGKSCIFSFEESSLDELKGMPLFSVISYFANNSDIIFLN